MNKPFRFQEMWLHHEKFQEFVQSKWKRTQPIMNSLHALSEELQEWNRSVFSNIFQRKQQLLARIEGVQKNMGFSFHRGLLKLESKLRRELEEVLQEEETFWFQKSRVKWLKNGDRNTRFFHLSTVIRNWCNKITAIKDDDGQWIHDKELVKNQIVTYFSNLFTEENDDDLYDIPCDIFPELLPADWSMLSKPYNKIEIEEVVHSMGALKAPGPDGFQALFFQKHWELVKEDVVTQSLEGKGLPDKMNETFITLSPKVDNPETAAHFRPIGLCNVIYKIVTKLLVNRIKPLLPRLISNTQGSFVPGRQITDNIIIMQEVIHTMKRK